ncbi:hypothetical protein ACFIJ5_18650 (plasmid) [Haloimpatiens sp. FM7330]|uniref:hypothetical protein n=1 Tax=Haloimpatiens sp. FM7330 TaxID=3298610 RepID=UPI003641C077
MFRKKIFTYKNKKRIIIFCIVLVFTYTFFIHFNSRNVISVPDKMIIYANKTEKEVNKQSNEFDKIFKLTNERFKFTLYSAKDIINDVYVDNLKKQTLGVEFIYSKKQKLKYFSNFSHNILEFDKLYFPLIEENKKIDKYSIVHTFQYGYNNHYINSSMGNLHYSKQLIEIIKNYK